MAEGEKMSTALEIIPGQGVEHKGPRIDVIKRSEVVGMKKVEDVSQSLETKPTTELEEMLAKAKGTRGANMAGVETAVKERRAMHTAAVKMLGPYLEALPGETLEDVTTVADTVRGIAGNDYLVSEISRNYGKGLTPRDPFSENWKEGKGSGPDGDVPLEDVVRRTLSVVARDLEVGDEKRFANLRTSIETQKEQNAAREEQARQEEARAKAEQAERTKREAEAKLAEEKAQAEKAAQEAAEKKRKDEEKAAEEAKRKAAEAEQAAREAWRKQVLGGIENGDKVEPETMDRLEVAVIQWRTAREATAGLGKIKSAEGFSFTEVQTDLDNLAKRSPKDDKEKALESAAVGLKRVMVDMARETGLIPNDMERQLENDLAEEEKHGIRRGKGGSYINPRERYEEIVNKSGKAGKGVLAGWEKVWRDEVMGSIDVATAHNEAGLRRYLGMQDKGLEERARRMESRLGSTVLAGAFREGREQLLAELAENIVGYRIGFGEDDVVAEYEGAIREKFDRRGPVNGGGIDTEYQRQMSYVTRAEEQMFREGTAEELTKWVREKLRLMPYDRTKQRSMAALNYFRGVMGELAGKRSAIQEEMMYYAEDRLALFGVDNLWLAADSAPNFEEAAGKLIEVIKSELGPEKSQRIRRLTEGVDFNKLERNSSLLRAYLSAKNADELYGREQDKAELMAKFKGLDDRQREEWLKAAGLKEKELEEQDVYKDEKGNFRMAVRSRMMKELGLDEVDLNTTLWLYDVSGRRSKQQAFSDDKEIMWKHRDGSNFAKLIRYGTWRVHKTRLDPAVAGDYNLGFGDITMMFSDEEIKAAGARGERDLVSAGTLSGNGEGLPWLTSKSSKARLFWEYADAMGKAISTQAAVESWIADPSWKSFGKVYGAWRQLYALQYYIQPSGDMVTRPTGARGEFSLREYLVTTFAEKTMVVQNRQRLMGGAGKYGSGQADYYHDKRALLNDLFNNIGAGNVEPDPSERQFKERLANRLKELTVNLKDQRTATERFEDVQAELQALIRTLIAATDKVTEIRAIR